MKTFRTILNEILTEHAFHPEKEFPGRAMGIISAHKSEYDDATSRHMHNLLHKDLQDHGLKVVPVDGVYKGTSERSLIALHPHLGNDHNHVLKTLTTMGKKYGQESILHKAHDSEDAQLHFTNSKDASSVNIGKLHMGKTGDSYSKLQDGRTFVFESEITRDSAMLKHGNDYNVEHGLAPLHDPDMSESSHEKQHPIAKAFTLAASDHPEYKKRVFNAYKEQMPDMVRESGANDYDGLKAASYHKMASETEAQYNHLSKHINFSFHNGEHNYESSKHMLSDLGQNHHLHVFKGGDKHEFLHHEDSTGLSQNDKFRGVHDAFGHGVLGNSFGPKGEEKAWGIHSQMYSSLAKPAMSSETRGQNSWVNYSGVNKGKQMKDYTYAPQKAVLLPPEMTRHDYNGKTPPYLKDLMS